MTSIPGLKIDDSSYNVYQEIDLAELFEVDSVSNTMAEKVGLEVVERIVTQAQGGKSIKGNSLKRYSDDYVDSDEFKAAGKSASKVNMTLYGDMLAQIEVLEIVGSKIKIGWNDETQQKKAYAHMTGFKNHPTIKNGTKREFFGANRKMLDEIKDQFLPDLRNESPDRDESNASVFTALNYIDLIRDQEEKKKRSSLSALLLGFGNGEG